jgi:hypothetical protein
MSSCFSCTVTSRAGLGDATTRYTTSEIREARQAWDVGNGGEVKKVERNY